MLIKKKWKDKWVKALRSGKYKQGKEKLHQKTPNGDIWCCLGVFCDVVAPEEWEEYDSDYAYDGSTFLPNFDFRKKVKLVKSSDIELDEKFSFLANMNDHKHKTFKQIANYIEKYL